jgi:hypothetical protein
MQLRQFWSLNEWVPVEATSYINLDEFAQLKGRSSSPAKSLSHLTAIVLQHRLSPLKDLHHLSWSTGSLAQSQQDFAALEAYASWKIWKSLSCLSSVGLTLDKQNLAIGQPISLYSGKKVVSHSVTVEQPQRLNVALENEEPRMIKNMPSRIVIEIQQVLILGHIASYHLQPLSHLQTSQSSFCLIASLRCVCTRSSEPPMDIPPPINTFPEMMTSAEPAASVPLPQSTIHSQAPYDQSESKPESDSDFGSDSEFDFEYVSSSAGMLQNIVPKVSHLYCCSDVCLYDIGQCGR